MLSITQQYYSLSNFSTRIQKFPVMYIPIIPIFMDLIIHTQISLDIYKNNYNL